MKFRGYTAQQSMEYQAVKNAVNRWAKIKGEFGENAPDYQYQYTILYDMSNKYGIDLTKATKKEIAKLNMDWEDVKILRNFRTAREVEDEAKKQIAKEEGTSYFDITTEKAIERVEMGADFHDWVMSNTEYIYKYEQEKGLYIRTKGEKDWGDLREFRKMVEVYKTTGNAIAMYESGRYPID